MKSQVSLKNVAMTVFSRQSGKGLEQLVRATVTSKDGATGCSIEAETRGRKSEWQLGNVLEGESTHDLFVGELHKPCEVEFVLKAGERVADATRSTGDEYPFTCEIHVKSPFDANARSVARTKGS